MVFLYPCDQETGNTNEEIGGCRSSIASCDRELGNTRDGDSRHRSTSSMKDRQMPINVFTGLTMIHSNCQSAMNKRSEILDLVNSERPHVLALTEFGASGDINDGELGIDGYTLYRGDHSDGKGGLGKGVALYMHNSLNHSACPNMDGESLDCSAWSLVKMIDGKRLLLGVVYRSPNSSDDNNQNLLKILRLAATVPHDFLMICGDFNLPLIDWRTNQVRDGQNSFSAAFLETVEDLNLFQHVRKSTRFRGIQNSCLDLVFTNEKTMVNEVTEIPPLGKSDHVCQKWSLIVGELMFKNTTRLRPNFKRANWTAIKGQLRIYKNDPSDPPNVMVEKLVAKIDELRETFIPHCRPRGIKHRLPWMRGNCLKKQRTEKWRKWKRYKETGLPRDYDAYKMERNRLGDMIRSAKSRYECGLIDDMKDNPALFHGHCRRSLKTKQGVSNVVDGSGKLTETEEEAAAALNTYYHSVFTRDDGSSPLPVFSARTDEKIQDVYIATEQVEEVLLGLNPNKASGPDGVESRFLKECAVELAPTLQEIYRTSLDQGSVPPQWKEANIVPIHKGGSKAVMGNFRPVALTSVICKVFERILCSAVMSFLMTNRLITDQQHGFVRGRSCQTNILLCLEKWTDIVDCGNCVDVAYFDYAKAFDKVSHRLLLLKLKGYGIDGKILDWLKNWLENRRQRVMVGNAMSEWLEVVSGTTQGTVLGFLLFLLYINDLPSECGPEEESLIMLLADDTKSYQEVNKNVEEHAGNQQKLQGRIDRIAQWAKEWKMEINAKKTKVMHIGKGNPRLTYQMEGSCIADVAVEKDIGFWITDDLSSSTHVSKARCKALAEIARIRRNFTHIDKRAFCVLYNQRVRPHLDYGMSVCPPGTSAESKQLEAVQSKATALVMGLKKMNSEERRKKLGLMALEQRRERGDLIEVFKILHGLTRIDPGHFWEVRNARGGPRLVKALAENGRKQRQSFFSYRVIQRWNLLGAELKTAPSLECFKRRLDERLLGSN